LAHMVAQRTRDIGLRMALGASRPQVLRTILWQGFQLVGAGLAAGMLGAALLTRVMQKLLYDVKPSDPAILAAVALTLAAVAAVACYAPAIRAASIDPMDALRHD
jgi:macrolide transport system ATP-binding/permease protein